MIKKLSRFFTSDQEIEADGQRFLSLLFLFIAGLMSFFTYTRIFFGFWKIELSFTPGFISTLIGIVVLAPLYMRGILKWNRSPYTITVFILILLVVASFVELATGGNQKGTVVYFLLAVSIVLSWAGMRGIAGISWILLLIAGVYSAIVNNIALGFNGFIYIAAGFLGLLMHTGLDPGSFMKSIKDEYALVIHHAGGAAKSDIGEVQNLIGKGR